MSAMCSMLDPSNIHSSVTPFKETLAILMYFLQTYSSSNYQSFVRYSGSCIVLSTFMNLAQFSIKHSELVLVVCRFCLYPL